ncbi:hypothetical protein Tsp_10382 [Trichinella spiralis]|uniref:hypothetical protein n=1 Tax=Trichinella spiralis TaxID=6334 RepID=UPI0001EFEA9D|nr:hypothetical protein Tsp_10382 [Trichinella spiralis]
MIVNAALALHSSLAHTIRNVFTNAATLQRGQGYATTTVILLSANEAYSQLDKARDDHCMIGAHTVRHNRIQTVKTPNTHLNACVKRNSGVTTNQLQIMVADSDYQALAKVV